MLSLERETAELTKRVRTNNRSSKKDVVEVIERLDKEMREAAILDFERAAQLRDIVMEIKSEHEL